MKISIINTPNRACADTFPPYGSLGILKYLKKNGFDKVDFINVDYYRKPTDEIIDGIINGGCDILGISAVTSTSYAFIKELSLKLKSRKDSLLIVLGGNMAASAEIILQKTGIDFCVLGEGEKIFLNFVKAVHEKKEQKIFL